MKYIKLFEDFNPSDIPQTEPQFTLWMMQNAPKAVLNPQEWFEEELVKPKPNYSFISFIIKELGLANRLSIPFPEETIRERRWTKQFADSLSLLHWAILYENVELAKVLIEGGAKLNVQNLDKQTPLHWAVYHEIEEIVKMLIDAGADLDIQDAIERNTPLHLATLDGNIEIAKMLIDAGADLNIKTVYKDTPWHLANRQMRQVLPELNPNRESL
jgi:hypothetical protein